MKTTDVRTQGFTLPEALICLAIIAMTILMALNGWRHLQHHAQLAEAADRLVDFLQRHQLQATRINQNCQLRVNQGYGWSLIGVSANCDGAPAGSSARLHSPYANIRLESSASDRLTLAGLRSTATPASLLLTGPSGRITIILSGGGRIRSVVEPAG